MKDADTNKKLIFCFIFLFQNELTRRGKNIKLSIVFWKHRCKGTSFLFQFC